MTRDRSFLSRRERTKVRGFSFSISAFIRVICGPRPLLFSLSPVLSPKDISIPIND
jgi:hypothetical protein